MSDLLKQLRGANDDACRSDMAISLYGEAADEIERLNGLLSQSSTWIPVNERMPEMPGTYLVMFTSKRGKWINHRPFVTECVFTPGDKLMWVIVAMDSEITHWMPLPEAPKEGT